MRADQSSVEVEMRHTQLPVDNPAYSDNGAATIAALEAELERTQRTHAEYVSSRVATEVQKVQQDASEQQQKLQASLEEQMQAMGLQLESAQAEVTKLRAELEQLKGAQT